jgi:hypothetical protein
MKNHLSITLVDGHLRTPETFEDRLAEVKDTVADLVDEATHEPNGLERLHTALAEAQTVGV